MIRPVNAPVTAYVAIGSNLGDRLATIQEATALLGASDDIAVIRVSSLWNNPAIGGPADSPDFLNGAIEVQTSLSADALLTRLFAIEQQLGRDRRQRWAPRTIDLDLLLYGDSVIRSDALTIPHPRLHERRFVLQPLAELAADFRIPTTGKTVGEHLASLE